MTTPNFSGILSAFTQTSCSNAFGTDIMSNVSNVIPLGTSGTQATYFGRYFYLGNLLIQFSDVSYVGTKFSNNTDNFTYPKAFSGNPYLIMATSIIYDNVSCAMSYGDNPLTQFNIGFNSNSSNFSFLAIGPK